MAGKERKLVTDEDVERYIEGSGRPRKVKGGKEGRGAIMELVALCCPKDDPFVDPVEQGKKAVRDWKDEHPPSPVRVLMKDGVWLKDPAAPECPSVEPPFGGRAGFEPATDQLRADCSPNELACAEGLVGAAVPDRTAFKNRHEWLIACGRCWVCGKPRGEDGSRTYCRSCADRKAEKIRRKRAARTEAAREAARLKRMENRRRRVAEGCCKKCGRPRDTGLPAACARCARANAAKQARSRARRVEGDGLSMAAE